MESETWLPTDRTPRLLWVLVAGNILCVAAFSYFLLAITSFITSDPRTSLYIVVFVAALEAGTTAGWINAIRPMAVRFEAACIEVRPMLGAKKTFSLSEITIGASPRYPGWGYLTRPKPSAWSYILTPRQFERAKQALANLSK
jgi:hypothetical protein